MCTLNAMFTNFCSSLVSLSFISLAYRVPPGGPRRVEGKKLSFVLLLLGPPEHAQKPFLCTRQENDEIPVSDIGFLSSHLKTVVMSFFYYLKTVLILGFIEKCILW